jgi:hypothetical protein
MKKAFSYSTYPELYHDINKDINTLESAIKEINGDYNSGETVYIVEWTPKLIKKIKLKNSYDELPLVARKKK